MTWIASTAHTAVQRCWGQECILYDVDSGNTHLVTPLAAAVLCRLQSYPSDLDSLTSHFADQDKSSAPSEMQTALTTILDDLARIDLIRWCPP